MVYSLEGCIKFVDIEVNSTCNRKCSYCPVSILPPPKVPIYMNNDLFDKVIAELFRINFAGIFSYHFYNEPLLRNDLEKLIVRVSDKLPKAFLVLYTNGDALSNARYKSLCDAGIDHFIVTRHAQTPIVTRPKQKVLYPDDLKISNRGGTLSKLEKPLTVPCYSPSERLIVSITGDILLCCNDPRRTQVMGNIGKQALEEIWLAEKFTRIRELLKSGNRTEAPPICKYCDDTEFFAPGEDHYKDQFNQKKQA